MATQQRNMRDSYEQGKTTTGVKANTATSQYVNGGNVYNSTVVRPSTTTTTNVVRGGVNTAQYPNSQVIRGPVTTGSVVRQSHLNPGYTTTTTTGSIVRPSQTYTTTGTTGSRLVNGQWNSTVYAPETYQVGTYDSQVDQTIGVGRRRRNSYVIEVKEGQSTFVEERYIGERIVNVTENRLEERIVHTTRPELQTRRVEVETWEDEPIVQERFIEKQVEVLVEKRIPVERYVDVEYDVYIERPIEKIIEKEIEIERVMEREIQKIVEVPIERIVEIPIERIIEQPVEYERRVNVPYERVVEKRVEDLIENIVYQDRYLDIQSGDLHKYPHAQVLPTEVVIHEQDKIVERPVYYDNIIEKIVDVPIERIIERPIERIVEKPVEHIVEHAVYYDNIIERTVQVPVEHIIEKPVERLVERPVYVDKIIERPVAIEVIKEQIKEISVEHIVERPIYIENVIHKPVEVLIENPVAVEKIVNVPVARYIDVAVQLDEIRVNRNDIAVGRPVPRETLRKLPIEYVVRKDNPVPVESTIEVSVPKVRKDVYERVIERPVEVLRVIEKAIPVEKIVEVEVERVTENAKYTEKVTQKKVPFDQVIEQKYEVIVQNVIEVPVEKEIHVPVKTISRAPVENRNYFEKDVHVNSTVWEPVQSNREVELQSIEINDEVLVEKTQQNKEQINQILSETRSIQVESRGILENNGISFVTKLNSLSVGNARLRSELSELESRLNIVEKDKDRLLRTSNSKVTQLVSYTVADPKISTLTRELEALIRENGSLVSQVKNNKSEVVTTEYVNVVEQPVVYEQVQYVEQPTIRRSINILDEPVYTTGTVVTGANPIYTSNVIRTSGYITSQARPVEVTTLARPTTYVTNATPVTYTTGDYTTTNVTGYRPSQIVTNDVTTYSRAPVTTTYSSNNDWNNGTTYLTNATPVTYTTGDYTTTTTGYRPSAIRTNEVTTFSRAPVTTTYATNNYDWTNTVPSNTYTTEYTTTNYGNNTTSTKNNNNNTTTAYTNVL